MIPVLRLMLSRIDQIDVQQEGPVKINPIRSFKDAGLHPVLIENIELSGYDNPTPIQKYTIPSMLQGYDVIGVAQTGAFQNPLLCIQAKMSTQVRARQLPTSCQFSAS